MSDVVAGLLQAAAQAVNGNKELLSGWREAYRVEGAGQHYVKPGSRLVP